MDQAIERLSGAEGVTKFMTMLAAFQALLHRYSGQNDFALSTPVTGRLRPETEGLIGCFINDIVLRADLSGDPSFRQLLGRVRETVLQAFDHQEMPFLRLVHELNPPRDPGRCTLVDVEFIFQNEPSVSELLPGLELSELPNPIETAGADSDLCLEAVNDEGLYLRLCYHADLFDESTAVRMLEDLQAVLEAVTADPDQRLSQLPGGKIKGAALPAATASAAPAARVTPPYLAPRSPVEQQLAAIWADLLSRERVGIQDHFFDIGGDSLLAVQAMLRAQATLGTALPAAVLFVAPTVAALAERIEAEARAGIQGGPPESAMTGPLAAASPRPTVAREPSLVLLQTGGAAPPLFLFHGLGGHVASFLPVARALAEARSVYALQALGLGPHQQPHDRIEAMADFYLQEIRQVQLRGPYLLAGWSMGGLIALEAAYRLQAAGEEVALVALLDSYLSVAELSAQHLGDHSVMHWLAPQLNLPLAELKKLPLDEQWQRLAERAKLADGIGANEIRRLAEVCQSHLAAFEACVPRPYQGRAVLFSAQGSDAPNPRWQSLCPRLCVETVPGNHFSMLRKPHAEVLAGRLAVHLQEAVSAGPAERKP